MTTTEPVTGGPAPGLVDRARNILLQPRAEWERISGESTGVGALLMGYALPLIAIGAICSFIGQTFIGTPTGFGVFRLPLVWGLSAAIVGLIVSLISVFVLGLVINALATTFGSTPNQERAHRLAVYGLTAAWLAAIVNIFPPLAILGLIGALYALYVIYLGLTPMMGTPEDKRVPYILVIVVVWIVLVVVASVVLGAITAATGAMGGVGARTFGY